MATGRTDGLMRQLRRAALLGGGGSLTDRQLLGRFLCSHDETAFEALMQRHGPMVLGVCRRVLGNSHDAEDAFQATFLVLVRKAEGIRRPDSLGNWLYGVAYRTALEARAAAARRRKKERQAADMAGHRVSQGDAGGELREVLDHELARLPDAYRTVVVLCDLEGKPQREAARLLGCPEGTVASRLSRARKLLASRLARRGFALARPALTAPVPPALAGSTLKAAAAVAAGQAAAAGAVSISVISLTEGVLKAMFLTKLKGMVPAVLAAGVLVGGLTVAAYPPWAAGQPQPPAVVRPGGPPAGGGAAQTEKLRLPTGPAPVQVLAKMSKDGQFLTLRMATTNSGRESITRSGSEVITYTQDNRLIAQTYPRGVAKAFDTHGREVDWAFLPKLLDKEVVALAAVGERVDPLHLRLTKEGILVFVIPQPKQPGALRGAGQELRNGPGGPGARPAVGTTGTPPGSTGLSTQGAPPLGGRPGIGLPLVKSPPADSPTPGRAGPVTPSPDEPAPGDAPTPPPTRATPPAPPPQDTKPESGDKNPFRPGDVSPPR